ncbi:hypothetical protein UFOVP1290_423 [uncultured Caudovirales phage]|uniref:Uncharacterized protein n=1 Tax=uncultured Caudovirales phage TaxID=2100421 RepID=A0A6J5RHN5_9CAUD|nr:hypothetical protein UFOVP1290_423 [uncultured Caudovirales phage]
MARFKMVGLDINSSPLQHRTWIVNNSPDYDQVLFTGLKSGENPLIDVHAYSIPDGYVADFNLPKANSWKETGKVLPQSVPNSHVAIIDGYVYLFGGQLTDKIFRATLNNPTDFVDTGATLPTSLYDGQLAIVDGYVYIFGGNDGYTTSRIYSASINDPLTWITNGTSSLPDDLQSSQLIIVNNYIYLFGGKTKYGTVSNIFRAATSDPLTWINTGSTLPVQLCESQVAIIDDMIYLFGGKTYDNTPTKLIYIAYVTDPLTWYEFSFLPEKVYGGQYFSIGDKGYLITPVAIDNLPRASSTRIFRCDLSSPGQWIDLGKFVPGEVSQSQFAIIYDIVYLFGGSGSTAIFACDYDVKYRFTSNDAISYGNITRTLYDSSPTLDLFKVLSYAPWRAKYGA